MSTSTIAARIKQARHMAGLSTQVQLLKKIPQWKASRLGNYEAGISSPGPDDIDLIAKATDVSPCWLMFGYGPIRPNKRDLQAIRYQNLLHTICQCQSKPDQLACLATAMGLSEKSLLEYTENPFLPIDNDTAVKLEQYLNVQAGWANEQHIENDPVCASFPEDIRELMMLYSGMGQDNRNMSLKLLRIISEG
jgi:transcriptional regulator with XRE-family HTH domain